MAIETIEVLLNAVLSSSQQQPKTHLLHTPSLASMNPPEEARMPKSLVTGGFTTR